MSDLPTEGSSQEIGRIAKLAFTIQKPSVWIDKELDGDTDFGIDYIIQLKNPSGKVEFSFYLQLKGTKSPDYSVNKDYINHSFKTKTLNFYLRQDPLVMVIVVDLRDEDNLYNSPVYYQLLDEAWYRKNKIQIESQNYLTVKIPTTNILNKKIDIYDFYKTRFDEKLAFQELKHGLNELKKPIPETIESIAKNIQEKPIYLKSMEKKNEAPWIDNPQGEIATELKKCSELFLRNQVKNVREILQRLDSTKANFTQHELAEFYLQMGKLVASEGDYISSVDYFKLAADTVPYKRYELAYYETRLNSFNSSPEELEELLAKLGDENLDECFFKAKVLSLLDRAPEALELLKTKYPNDTHMQFLICMVSGFEDGADEYLENSNDITLDSEGDCYHYYIMASRRYFHKATKHDSIYGKIFPLEGQPNFDKDYMLMAYSFILKAWQVAQNIGYSRDIGLLLEVSPFIFGYFENQQVLLNHLKNILAERPFLTNVLRQTLRLTFNSGNYKKTIELLSRLDVLDIDERAMYIFSLAEENEPKLSLEMLEEYESELLSSSYDNLAALFYKGRDIADNFFKTDLVEKYEKIIKNLPEAAVSLALHHFIKQANEEPEDRLNHIQKLYDDYKKLNSPLIIAEQLIRCLDPLVFDTSIQLIEIAEKILEVKELTNDKHLALVQALFTTKKWDVALSIANKNIAKGVDSRKWKIVKAAAHLNQGMVGIAYQLITEIMQQKNKDAEQRKFFIETCLSLGLVDKVVEYLESDLAAAKTKLDRIFILRRLIHIYKNQPESIHKLKKAIVKFGKIIDQNDCYLEGEYLHWVLIYQPIKINDDFIDYQQRLKNYLQNFPDSPVIKAAHIDPTASGPELIKSLMKITGTTQEELDKKEENKQKMRRSELSVPFNLRHYYINNTLNVYQTWLMSKTEAEEAKEYKIIHSNPLERDRFKNLIDNVDMILFEETSLLVLNDLGLLNDFLKIIPKFSMINIVFNHMINHSNNVMAIGNKYSSDILEAIQNNIHKLSLIDGDNKRQFSYYKALKDKSGLVLTDDLFFREILFSIDKPNFEYGNIFNILEYMLDKGIIDEDTLNEKILAASELGLSDINLGADFFAKALNYHLAKPDIKSYRDTKFAPIIDSYWDRQKELKKKYVIFLNILSFIDIQRTNINTICSLIYKFLEDYPTHDHYNLITMWYLINSLKLECVMDKKSSISTKHLELWIKYKEVMKEFYTEPFTNENILSTVLKVISGLEELQRASCFENLLCSFTSDSKEYEKLLEYAPIFNPLKAIGIYK